MLSSYLPRYVIIMEDNQVILVIGHACLDHLFICCSYPPEDSKIGSTTSPNRCIDQYNQRGGNAANNCTVLGLLKANPYYFGTISDTFEGRFIEEDFQSYGANLKYAIVKNAQCPLSFVTIAEDTGSRTIVHSNKNLPEVTLEEFQRIDLANFGWIHFEGRNLSNGCDMINHIRDYSSKSGHLITVSVEVEKVSQNLDPFIPLADVLFISKEFSKSNGFHSKEDAVRGINNVAKKDAIIICPWGENGAAALNTSTEELITCPSEPPSTIVDTLGAGDTFIASSVYAISRKWALADALKFGCCIAGSKIGVKGWNGLRTLFQDEKFVQFLNGRFPSLCLSK